MCWPTSAALAPKPANLTFEEAAALPYGGLLASHFLRRLGVQKGQRFLIYGASGAIGNAATQLAKYLGAEVTGVCSSANLELVRSLGATTLIDYTKEDFTRRGDLTTSSFDAVGRRQSAQALANSAVALAPTEFACRSTMVWRSCWSQTCSGSSSWRSRATYGRS